MTYEVLKALRDAGELTTPPLNAANRLRYPTLPVRPVIRFWDAGEGNLTLDAGDDQPDPEPTPTWHYRGRR